MIKSLLRLNVIFEYSPINLLNSVFFKILKKTDKKLKELKKRKKKNPLKES